MPNDIRAFFEAYRNAFNRLDGEAVARLYAIPSGIVSDRGYTHWIAHEEIRDNMVALCGLYAENGFVAAKFSAGAFIRQGDMFAVADIAWNIERTAGNEPWRFDTTYNLMRTAEGWRIVLCTAYSEQRLSASPAP